MGISIGSNELDLLRQFADLAEPIIKVLSDVVYFVRPNGNITYINQAISRFGLEPADVLNKSFIDLIHPENQSAAKKTLDRVLLGEPQTFQFKHRDNHGDYHPVRSYSQPVFKDSHVIGICGIVSEIGLSYDYEKALQRRAAQLNLLNAIGEKIVSTLELEKMLSSSVRLIQKSFGFFHVAIHLIDRESQQVKLTAVAGSMARMFPSNHALKIGEGLVGSVCASRQIILANDVLLEPRYINRFPERIPTKAELCLPILIGGEAVGVLDLQSPTINAFDEHDVRTMEAVTRQLAVAIENARLYEEAQLRIRERERAEKLMRLQRDLLAELSSTTDLSHALNLILQTLVRIDGITGGCIYRVNSSTGGFSLMAHIGLSQNNLSFFENFPGNSSHHTQTFKSTSPSYASQTQIHAHISPFRQVLEEEGIVSSAILPVIYRGRPLAQLVAFSQSVIELPQESETILETLAPLVGAVIVRLESEQALAQSESKHRALVEAIPDLMFILDRNGIFTDYKAVPNEELFIPPEQFLGKSVVDIFPPGLHVEAMQRLDRAFTTGEPQQFEYELPMPSSPEPVAYEAHFVCADQDRAVVTVRDISERKRAERTKAQILELERALSNISTRFIAYSDIDDVTDDSLKDSGEALGADVAFVYRFIENKSIARANFKWVRPGHQQDQPFGEDFEMKASTSWFDRIQHNQIVAYPGNSPEDEYITAYLQERKVHALLLIPLFLEGDLTGFLGYSSNTRTHSWTNEELSFSRNVAEILARAVERHYIAREIDRQMDELERTNKRLVELDKLKSRFLSGISNELRTPLHSIIGFAEVLSDGRFGEVNTTQKEYLADIHDSGRQLLGAIDQMLDFSHLEANRVTLYRSTFSPAELVEEVAASFSNDIARASQHLVVSISPNLPDITADRKRLKQVLSNLLDNAHKFSPAESTIALSCQALFKKSLLFSVADDGPGIPTEQQEVIFDQFHRINHTDHPVPGSGLGLAISRRIVEMHSGRIWVESEPGSGSTFYVLLPITA